MWTSVQNFTLNLNSLSISTQTQRISRTLFHRSTKPRARRDFFATQPPAGQTKSEGAAEDFACFVKKRVNKIFSIIIDFQKYYRWVGVFLCSGCSLEDHGHSMPSKTFTFREIFFIIRWTATSGAAHKFCKYHRKDEQFFAETDRHFTLSQL